MAASGTRPSIPEMGLLNRYDFPDDFIFGSASSAFQYEGAASEDGRLPSIWDTFIKDKDLLGGETYEAIDHYHRVKDDVKILKQMGVDSYRFSISWSRVLPSGRRCGGVNEKAIDFYNTLIQDLQDNDIEPYVTLFHWDLPQALEDEYMGFLCPRPDPKILPRIVDDFRDYADLCFKRFGEKVKNWITFNEPYSFSVGGYATGRFAPGRCTPPVKGGSFIDMSSFLPSSPLSAPDIFTRRHIPTAGNSGTEPYIVAHNQLLAHAAAVDLYRQKYKACQKGNIGISLLTIWMEPYSCKPTDHVAAKRALDFVLGWFMDPLTTGNYPENMKVYVGSRLPKFLDDKSELVEGSFDFIGLNYYTANYVMDASEADHKHHLLDKLQDQRPSYVTDAKVIYKTARNGVPIGEQAGSSWLYVYPKGILDILHYTKVTYKDPVIYITENGCDEKNDATVSLSEALYDPKRISYHSKHLDFLKKAIDKDVKLKGYFVWSLLDNFEWAATFSVRFGMNFVDYTNQLKRYPKLSSGWFKSFLEKKPTEGRSD